MHAFGVELVGREPIEGLLAGPGPLPTRRTVVHLGDSRSVERLWPVTEAHRLIERRRPDGRLFLAVDHAPGAGYRIEAPEYGVHLVSADGSTWTGAPVSGPAWHWQKLVFAQVLPTVAVLRGLEVFHAAAVSIGGQVLGLIAPSGGGKSSTAAHLVAGGARFVADDVLAVEESAEGLVAHPGPQFASVHLHELEAMEPRGRRRMGTALGRSEKCHLRPDGETDPLRLGALAFLARAPDGPAVGVEPLEGSAQLLLASTFAPHVTTRRRLESQLAVCAAVQRDVALWKVTTAPGGTARGVAAELWGRLA